MLLSLFRKTHVFVPKINYPSLFLFTESKNATPPSSAPEITKENAQLIIEKWVKENKVVLFMKGTPLVPLCGYSNFVVELLKKYGIFGLTQGWLNLKP